MNAAARLALRRSAALPRALPRRRLCAPPPKPKQGGPLKEGEVATPLGRQVALSDAQMDALGSYMRIAYTVAAGAGAAGLLGGAYMLSGFFW